MKSKTITYCKNYIWSYLCLFFMQSVTTCYRVVPFQNWVTGLGLGNIKSCIYNRLLSKRVSHSHSVTSKSTKTQKTASCERINFIFYFLNPSTFLLFAQKVDLWTHSAQYLNSLFIEGSNYINLKINICLKTIQNVTV